MNKIFSQVLSGVTTAAIGIIVGWILLGTNWIGSSIKDKFWYELTSSVVEHLDISTNILSSNGLSVDGHCLPGAELIAASCYSVRQNPIREEAAGGPVFDLSNRKFKCNKAGDTALITAAAVCMKSKYVSSSR